MNHNGLERLKELKAAKGPHRTAEGIRETVHSSVSFGCDFDEKGKCIHYRERVEKNHGRLPDETSLIACGSCCSRCAESVGYFISEVDLISKEQLEFLVKTYKERKGFLGPEGCKIPAKWRSNICTFHACRVPYDKDNKDRVILTIARDAIRYLKEYQRLTYKGNKCR